MIFEVICKLFFRQDDFYSRFFYGAIGREIINDLMTISPMDSTLSTQTSQSKSMIFYLFYDGRPRNILENRTIVRSSVAKLINNIDTIFLNDASRSRNP